MIKSLLLPVLLVPTAVLSIPAAAMAFRVEGGGWSPFDFALFWILIAVAVLAYKVLASRATTTAYRAAAALACLTGFVLLWITGAVAIIGSEDNPANALYGGVLLVGLAGAAVARLKPQGMAWASIATALAQFLVPVVALVVWPDDFSPGVIQVFVLNFVFVLLFAVAGLLFWQAGSRAA